MLKCLWNTEWYWIQGLELYHLYTVLGLFRNTGFRTEGCLGNPPPVFLLSLWISWLLPLPSCTGREGAQEGTGTSLHERPLPKQVLLLPSAPQSRRIYMRWHKAKAPRAHVGSLESKAHLQWHTASWGQCTAASTPHGQKWQLWEFHISADI